jgi:putative SbcD/Mre11-related phosphoesterase
MQPVVGERAILHRGVLALADLHLGFEYELRKFGISIPSKSSRKLKRVRELVKKTKVERLLILGDLKHEIPFPSGMEELEVREFINHVKKFVHVEVVKGNHDGNLDFLKIPIYSPSGVVIGDVGYFHGNAWPDKKLLSSKYLVIGHTHPTIVFEDKLGHRSRLPCWLRVKLNAEKCEKKFGVKSNSELIVMPAFSELSGGIAVNSSREKLIGPILKLVNLDQAEVYLLDGTNLGKLGDLGIGDKKAFNRRKRRRV